MSGRWIVRGGSGPSRTAVPGGRANRAIGCLLASLIALAASPAFAADEDVEPIAEAADENAATATPPTAEREPGSDAFRMPAVTVVGSADAVFELVGSGAFIDTEQIRNQSYADSNQVLRQVPGVYVRQEDGFGLFPNISLRGVDTTRNSKLTVMEDGVLTAPAPYASPSAYYSPNAGRMSNIEVLKGSSQVRYGPHTTGGVINYVSTPIPEEQTVYVRALYGWSPEIRVHAYTGDTLETELGTFGYLIEGFVRDADGFKRIDDAPNRVDRDDTGFTLVEPMVKLSWEPPTEREQRFEFKFGYTNLDADETYLGLSEADFRADPFRRYSASRFDNIQTDHFRSHLRHVIDAGHGIEVTTTAYGNYFERNWFKLNDLRNIEEFGGAPGATVNMGLSQALAGANGGFGLDVLRGERAGTLRVRNNAREYYLYGVESVANKVFETESFTHDVTAGIRFHEDRERRDQQDESFLQDDTGEILSRTLGANGAAGWRWERTRALSLFVEDSIEWNRFTFVPGFRYEQLWLAFNDYNTGEDGSGKLELWAPGLGIRYALTPQWTLLGGVHRGFSPSSPRDLVLSDIEEETSVSTELGVRHADESLGLDASLIGFYSAFDDLIVVDNIGGAGSGESENAGKVDSYGLELGLRFDPSIPAGWRFRNPFFVNLTYTRARLDGDSRSTDPESIFSGGEDGNDVPYIPEIQVNFGASLEFERFGVFATASWVDESFATASNTRRQIDSLGNPDSRFGETDSYFLLDLSAEVEIREGIKLIGGVQNVTDEEYIASRVPHGPRPGQPRFGYLGLELAL